MSIAFSAKISMLRKEREITQRQAAKDLGISQALLSHYEKGIRECSLDFAARAAQYYEVTTDYLLGLSENKKDTFDVYAQNELETDAVLTPQSAVRALLFLAEKADAAGDNAAGFFCDFFSLGMLKYVGLVAGDTPQDKALTSLCLNTLTDERRRSRQRAQDLSSPPMAFATVLLHAEQKRSDTAAWLTEQKKGG